MSIGKEKQQMNERSLTNVMSNLLLNKEIKKLQIDTKPSPNKSKSIMIENEKAHTKKYDLNVREGVTNLFTKDDISRLSNAIKGTSNDDFIFLPRR